MSDKIVPWRVEHSGKAGWRLVAPEFSMWLDKRQADLLSKHYNELLEELKDAKETARTNQRLAQAAKAETFRALAQARAPLEIELQELKQSIADLSHPNCQMLLKDAERLNTLVEALEDAIERFAGAPDNDEDDEAAIAGYRAALTGTGENVSKQERKNETTNSSSTGGNPTT